MVTGGMHDKGDMHGEWGGWHMLQGVCMVGGVWGGACVAGDDHCSRQYAF